MSTSDPILFWTIRCFNKSTGEFFDRALVLDWSKVTDDEKGRILRMADRSTSHRDLAAYRSRFVEPEEGLIERLAAHADAIRVLALPDYFEDEHRNRMDSNELAQAVYGQPCFADVRGVMRLGPAPLKARDQWSRETANMIARLLQIIENIAQSGWLRGPLPLTLTLMRGDARPFVESARGGDEVTARVLRCIWQLCSPDEALSRGCQAYLRHVGDQRKAAWVGNRLDECMRSLEKRHGLLMPPGYSARELMETFIYGLGYAQRRSGGQAEERLTQLVREYGTERAALSFHIRCRELCWYAFDVWPVMKQDFQHWIESEGCVGPDRTPIDDIVRPPPGARR